MESVMFLQMFMYVIPLILSFISWVLDNKNHRRMKIIFTMVGIMAFVFVFYLTYRQEEERRQESYNLGYQHRASVVSRLEDKIEQLEYEILRLNINVREAHD